MSAAVIFAPGDRVRFVPGHAHGDATHPDCEDGTVSSQNGYGVFVRFDKQVEKFGWEGATSQCCTSSDLVRLPLNPGEAVSDVDDAFDALVRESGELVDAVKPLFAGHHPAAQSSALAELLAIWAAGHPEFAREGLIAKFVDAALRMIPFAEREIFGAAGHPGNDRGRHEEQH